MIVVLSTFNGRTRIAEMLEAMLRVRIPAGTQIHIVDNASRDGTLDVLHDFAARLPLVIHSQPVPGKNHCLNLVLNAVSDRLAPDELVVFADDDILPCPEWLEEMMAAGKAQSDCDVFAGRILPHWPCSGITHLDALRCHFGILFSLTSESEGPCHPALAWGPNMAVRAHVFKAGVRFDPAFGPNGGINYPMGSETELMERLEADGHRAWFVERACVRHMVRASQLDRNTVLQRGFRHGYGVGWRRQRGRQTLRLLMLQWTAARGIFTARLRNGGVTETGQLLQDFQEAWARGLASGSMYEYRRVREIAESTEAFPERRRTARGPLNH